VFQETYLVIGITTFALLLAGSGEGLHHPVLRALQRAPGAGLVGWLAPLVSHVCMVMPFWSAAGLLVHARQPTRSHAISRLTGFLGNI